MSHRSTRFGRGSVDGVYQQAPMNDPRLNQLAGTLAPTGSFAQCTNAFHVYDMVGNVHEWTSDPRGRSAGGTTSTRRSTARGATTGRWLTRRPTTTTRPGFAAAPRASKAPASRRDSEPPREQATERTGTGDKVLARSLRSPIEVVHRHPRHGRELAPRPPEQAEPHRELPAKAAKPSATLRSVPEDFVVDEIPAFAASGEGEHLYLQIRRST